MKKSVKAQKLEKNYNEKIDVILSLYKAFGGSWYDIKKAVKELKELTNDFSNCLSTAYRFNLISENDFEALWNDNVVNGNNYINVLETIYNMEV